MLVKEKVLEAIKSLPEEFSFDDLFERLIVIQKIDTGLQQVEEGNVHTTAEARKRLEKWFK